MRTTIWKFKPLGAKEAEYTVNLAREEGLKYIEVLRQEDRVVEVIEEKDMFIIKLAD